MYIYDDVCFQAASFHNIAASNNFNKLPEHYILLTYHHFIMLKAIIKNNSDGSEYKIPLKIHSQFTNQVCMSCVAIIILLTSISVPRKLGLFKLWCTVTVFFRWGQCNSLSFESIPFTGHICAGRCFLIHRRNIWGRCVGWQRNIFCFKFFWFFWLLIYRFYLLLVIIIVKYVSGL